MLIPETFLSNFRFTQLKYTVRAIDEIRFPPHPGSTLRGGFGVAFKNVACTRDKTDCHNCLLINSCPFGYIFQTPPPEDAERLSTLSDIPRPYIIRPDESTGGAHGEGEVFTFEQVIVGKALDYLPYFIVAFVELGEMGLGRDRGRYELVSVEAMGTEGEDIEVFTSESGSISNVDVGSLWGDLTSDEKEGDGGVRVEFITPLKLKVDGVILEWAPPFEELVMNLARRINNLAYFHCGIEKELDFNNIAGKAMEVEIASQEISIEGWSRYSRRQNRRIPMKGVVGCVEYDGGVDIFLPMLKLGEYLHLGKNTTMGFGRIGVGV